MSATSRTLKTNIDDTIDDVEAERRIDEMETAFRFGHEYARVKRVTKMDDGAEETDGEHALSLASMGIAYAMKYHPELDPYKLAFYFLFHDGDEAFVGDESTLGATAESLKAKKEREALGRQQWRERFKDFPQFMDLIDSLDDLSVPEYAFAKAFDKLAPGYMHKADKGATIREKYGFTTLPELIEATAATDAQMAKYAADFPDVIQLRTTMHHKVARIAFAPDDASDAAA